MPQQHSHVDERAPPLGFRRCFTRITATRRAAPRKASSAKTQPPKHPHHSRNQRMQNPQCPRQPARTHTQTASFVVTQPRVWSAVCALKRGEAISGGNQDHAGVRHACLLQAAESISCVAQAACRLSTHAYKHTRMQWPEQGLVSAHTHTLPNSHAPGASASLHCKQTHAHRRIWRYKMPRVVPTSAV